MNTAFCRTSSLCYILTFKFFSIICLLLSIMISYFLTPLPADCTYRKFVKQPITANHHTMIIYALSDWCCVCVWWECVRVHRCASQFYVLAVYVFTFSFIRSLRNCSLQGSVPDLSRISQLGYLWEYLLDMPLHRSRN